MRLTSQQRPALLIPLILRSVIAQASHPLLIGARFWRLIIRRRVARICELARMHNGNRAGSETIPHRRARPLTHIILPRVHKAQLRERNIRRTPLRARAHRLRPRQPRLLAPAPRVAKLERRVRAALSLSLPHAVPPTLKQNTALLAAVRRRRRQAAGLRREPPFLDVGLDEHEAQLAEVDVHLAGPVGADRGEEVLRFEPVRHVFEFLAVAREEHGSRARSVADADDVALDVLGAVGCPGEGLVVPAEAVGEVGY